MRNHENEYKVLSSAKKAHFQSEFFKVANNLETGKWKDLKHPNVAQIVECADLGGTKGTFFVTSRYEKRILDECQSCIGYFKVNRFSLARRWLAETLEGVNYLHTMGLCHMNVSGQTVAVDSKSRAVLTGLSYLQQSEGREAYRVGATGVYRPPEVCGKVKDDCFLACDGEKVDVWCYGMTALRVLLGGYFDRGVASNRYTRLWTTSEDLYLRQVFPFVYRIKKNMHYFSKLLNKAHPFTRLTSRDVYNAWCFISHCLEDQQERISISEALNHPFIREVVSVSEGDVPSLREDYKVRPGLLETDL